MKMSPPFARLARFSLPRAAAVVLALCAVLFFWGLAAPAQAQQPSTVQGVNLTQAADAVRQSDSRIDQAGALDMLFGILPTSNPLFLSALQQQTVTNTAIVHQGAGTTGNVAGLTQRGTGNLAVLFQLGSRNEVDLVQEGNNNLFGVRLGSDDNLLNVAQIGNRNVYLLDYKGAAPLNEPNVIQEGNGNRAVQTGVGSTLFGIQQRGNGMNITIRHNQ